MTARSVATSLGDKFGAGAVDMSVVDFPRAR
jgi:hypothetical protein